MKQLFENLENCKTILEGRVASNAEIDLLSQRFYDFIWLQDFKEIVKNYRIIGQEFSLHAEADSSGIGMEMEWATPIEQIEEAFEFYPGIILVKHGFLPVGKCLSGSGDPYFLKAEDNDLKIYRGLHDLAKDNIYRDDMTEFVISLEDLINSFQ
jgi:hypothetical protein